MVSYEQKVFGFASKEHKIHYDGLFRSSAASDDKICMLQSILSRTEPITSERSFILIRMRNLLRME